MGTSNLFLFYMVLLLMVMVVNMNTTSFHSGPPALPQERSPGHHTSTVVLPLHSRARKLIGHGMCSIPDISISQSKDSTSGIPQYIVQIVNTCVARCAPSNIHLHCGWFASAKMVNPRTFKRLFYDDCLVNEGRPLKNSQIIRFTYSNSFMYPLEFKSARFC